MKRLSFFLLIVLVVACLASDATACPNCKTAVAESGGEAMSQGFAWSIALLLAVPASIVTGWVIALRRLFAGKSPG